jgi:hypothetical protein
MGVSASGGRQEPLDTPAGGDGRLGFTHPCLAEAFDDLDPGSADRLEEELPPDAVEAIGEADLLILTALQDSMPPVEVGDAALRSALAAGRERIPRFPGRPRELLRTLGR